MSKTLLAIAFIVAEVAVAVLAPELLPATWSLLAVTAATAAIEVGIALAANALIGPSLPQGLGQAVSNQIQRLYVSMDTTTARKIVFGDTAGATDLRYQTFTGTDQRYYEQIIAVASHKVNAIYEIWFDNEIAWTAAGGVQGRYLGFLTVDVRNAGTSGNGIAIDSTWTSTCTLTGCAYVRLKFDLLGTATDGTNNSPFASNVTSRVTIRTQGALVYDPRLDSTVAGGSGSQRAAGQSSWAWDANASRNPALQLLFYLLGWQINSKLVVGMGLPPARIDLASFAVAANACDASITLNGGGTEPRYRTDCVLSESDNRQGVVEAMAAAMNAVLRDAGGKLSLTVLSNDLASPVASFTESDILGEEQWDQTPAITSMFNICRGRRVDNSDAALYQMVDVPEASLTSNDGIDRIDTMDMPFVSSNGQAQRLLKQRLERKQYQGKYTLTGNARWWQVSLGNVIQLSHQGLGWANKLFRIASQSIARTGETKLVLIEENAAIYAWGNNESAAVTPGAPTIYNPANSPLLRGVNSASKSGVVIDQIALTIISADSAGAIKSGELPCDVGCKASIGLLDITMLGAWGRTATSGVTSTIGSSTGILNVTAFDVGEALVPVSFTYNGVTRNSTAHIIVQNDAAVDGGGTGGGTASSVTTLGDTAGSTYDLTSSVSATLTATAGSGGQVACATGAMGFKITSPVGGYSIGCYGKWQWRVLAGTFADITAEVHSTVAAAAEDDPDGYLNKSPGNLNVGMTKTGLTSGTAYEFRFAWRSDTTGKGLYKTSGTFTATGS